MAAAMGLLLKANSSLVVNRDWKPSLPLKWRRNLASLQTTTQISLPSSMIKNSSITTSTGFIQTIKYNSISSSSNRGSALRVQCVMNNSSKKNCFKKEEHLEEEEDPFKQGFGKVILKVLETPVVAALLKVLDTPVVAAMLKILEKPLLGATLVWILLTGKTTIYFWCWLAFDLCEVIWSIYSQYSRIRKGENIKIPVGAVLCSILAFLAVWFTGFGQEPKLTLEWTPSSKGSVVGFAKVRKMILEWTPSLKGSVDAKESGGT